MPRIRRLLEAASELSTLLTAAGVVHAFHGGFLAVLLGSSRDTEVRSRYGRAHECLMRW